MLMIPTVEISQSYFLMDLILGTLRFDDTLDKHVRLLGPSATSKSIAITTFLKRYDESYKKLIVPMSAYMTLEKLKSNIESNYIQKRRNYLEPKDSSRKLILMIDDVHLSSNLKTNTFEFLRTWSTSRGYYDIQKGFFKNIGEFGTLMAENSEYRKS
jgi:hypothetical protein